MGKDYGEDWGFGLKQGPCLGLGPGARGRGRYRARDRARARVRARARARVRAMVRARARVEARARDRTLCYGRWARVVPSAKIRARARAWAMDRVITWDVVEARDGRQHHHFIQLHWVVQSNRAICVPLFGTIWELALV